MKQIITHLTDTDFYKYTMGQWILHRYPNVRTHWKFKIRTAGVQTANLVDEVNRQLDMVAQLRHTKEELDYLAKIPWFTQDYIEFLEDLQLKRRYIKCYAENGQVAIEAEGPELNVQWWEIFCLQIVQELWMGEITEEDRKVGDANLDVMIGEYNKLIEAGKKFTLSDFGSRRRSSKEWQEHVIQRMIKECKAFVGTSNVYFAMKYGVKPIGTFAHQTYAITQGLDNVPVRQAQIEVLEGWTKEYRGDLGIALSDNFGFKAFLKDFDKYYMKLFDGCRHDSGNPFVWGDMLIAAYKKNGINPMTKVACFSDGLDTQDVIDIVNYFDGKINIAIGQGTKMMNNLGRKALSMVMKVVETNGKPVVKLSDAPGKTMCENQEYIDYVKKVYEYEPIPELAGHAI